MITMNDINLDCKYVTIEIKKIIADKHGGLREVIEKKEVPDFVAEILTGKPASFSDSILTKTVDEHPEINEN